MLIRRKTRARRLIRNQRALRLLSKVDQQSVTLSSGKRQMKPLRSKLNSKKSSNSPKSSSLLFKFHYLKSLVIDLIKGLTD